MHYYGIDPEHTPLWKLAILEKSQALLVAEETLRLATALRMAKARPEAFKRYVRDLQRQAKPVRTRHDEVEIARIRPEQEKWFLENRIPYLLIEVA